MTPDKEPGFPKPLVTVGMGLRAVNISDVGILSRKVWAYCMGVPKNLGYLILRSL